MTKRHFIALADIVKLDKPSAYTGTDESQAAYSKGAMDQWSDMLIDLADFCQSTNPRFNRARWLAYVAGECGPNGGKR